MAGQLAVLAIESRYFTSGLTLDGAFLNVGSLVPRYFSLTNAEFRLQFSIFPIQLENNKRAPFDLTFAIEFVDFLAMKQKFPDPLGHGHFMTRLFVWLNVGVVEKGFAVLDSGKGIADVGFTRPN